MPPPIFAPIGTSWARIRERADAPSLLLLLRTTHVHRIEHDGATTTSDIVTK
jgi:hypothetical protein